MNTTSQIIYVFTAMILVTLTMGCLMGLDRYEKKTNALIVMLLAYLVDRAGAMCTNGEIAAALWGEEDGEESGHESYLKNLRADLSARMQECGCEAAFIHRRGLLGLVPDMLYCDYFSFLAGAKEVRRNYRGEYMSQYSWAELTHAALDREMGIQADRNE